MANDVSPPSKPSIASAPARAAKEIPVSALRQTLIWPFIVSDAERPKEHTETLCAMLRENGWTPTPPLDLIPKSDGPVVGGYEEAVYFHDFVRDFLYCTGEDVPMQIFKRSNLQGLTARINGQDRFFAVDLCAVQVFQVGVVLLTLDLRYEGPSLNLAEAQTIMDHLRRAYPGFWFGKGKPGLCPTRVALQWEGRRETDVCDLGPLEDRDEAEHVLKDELREPVFPWWSAILDPLPVEGTRCVRKGLRLRQVLDERIPLMTTLSLTPAVAGDAAAREAIAAVSDGDWFRLAAADQAGDAAYPYDPAFLDTLRSELFYDRFMPYASHQSSGTDLDGSATRYLFAGYHFAAVGAGSFFDGIIAQHMRRHYRQMMTVCLLEFSALLMISSRLSAAARFKVDKEDSEKKFRERVIATERAFLDFVHRYRFTGVSNHLQAREMFSKMRQSFELDRLFDDIGAELESASDLALALEQRDAAQASQRASRATETLTEVATLAAVVGLASGVAGMNLFFDKVVGLDAQLLVFGFLLSLTSLGATYLTQDRDHSVSRRLKKALGALLSVGLAFSLVGMLFHIF